MADPPGRAAASVERPRAVISGLGPSGSLSALTLLDAGFEVDAVEQRPAYLRPIHVGLRQSYLSDLAAIDPELGRAALDVTTPIDRFERWELDADSPRVDAPPPPGHVAEAAGERLATLPIAHGRVDDLERLFSARLDALVAEGAPLRLHRRRRSALTVDDHGVRVELGDGLDLGWPDLLVVAEGGKPGAAQALGARHVRLSRPRHYLSVHVGVPIGPVSRRLDVIEDGVERSAWATGHGDPGRGTWVVVEAPARGDVDDRAALEVAAPLFADGVRVGDEIDDGFRGTFRFEQQLVLNPAVADAAVFLGDAAGMGHHAQCPGLEVGAIDQVALRKLATAVRGGAPRGEAFETYAAAVRATRVALVASGMREYVPAAARASSEELCRIVDEAARRAAAGAEADIIAWLEGSLTGGAC